MHSADQKAFLQAVAWLRPVTRWAASFAFRTQGFLPAYIRHLPLKWVKWMLTRYQRNSQRSGCGSH